MRQLLQKLEKKLNDIKLKSKLRGLYIICMLIPLLLTDVVIIAAIVSNETNKQKHEMENVANSVRYNLESALNTPASLGTSLYLNQSMRDFLNEKYATPYEYLIRYQEYIEDSFFESMTGINNTYVYLYTDNDTILNGGNFMQLSNVTDSEWYKAFTESERSTMARFYFDTSKAPVVEPRRKFIFVRSLNSLYDKDIEKILLVELDYSSLVRQLKEMNYEYDVYLCSSNFVMMSNCEGSHQGQPFEWFTQTGGVGYKSRFEIYGETLDIYVMNNKQEILGIVGSYIPLLLCLLIVNLILPWTMTSMIEKSILNRLFRISNAFADSMSEQLVPIEEVEGSDEIGDLMNNYNHLVSRFNNLIQTMYKDKMREQEIDIARQNAELLALHSQINPHFMFNALESIRMHSVIKKEYETAQMVEKLAVMERQNVDWNSDVISAEKELEFVEAYLSLQKYRFGDRLSFDVDIEEECRKMMIPKLSIVTFTENACVHGIETKSNPGWVFVRVYMEHGKFCIDVEDTGGGMSEEFVREIRENMQEASIQKLKEQKSIGITNTCLRLKMLYQEQVEFEIDSEESVGTLITIRIPSEMMTVSAD